MTLKSFRLKILVLFTLIVSAIYVGAQNENTVSACQQCVFPTGGICVGCSGSSTYGLETGNTNCVPSQASCSCTVSGGSCGMKRGGGFYDEFEWNSW